jgi:hypothetical protein
VPFLGSNFFPSVDSGQVLMHVRVPVGTRVEETAQALRAHRAGDPRVIPSRRSTMVDNIGLPSSEHQPHLQQHRRDRLAGRRLPDRAARRPRRPPTTCASCASAARENSRTPLLVPAGRHRQPDPELRRAGADRRADPRRDLDANFAMRSSCSSAIRAIPGVADARIQQSNRARCSTSMSTAPRRSCSA